MSLLDTASLLLTPNAYKEGKLYSVIPSDGSGDFTFTRATTATRVNSDGLVELVPYNLLQRSEEFENAAWTKTNLTVTPNFAISPSGLMDADLIDDGTVVTNLHWLYQLPTLNNSTTYTITFYAKYVSRKYMSVNIFNGSTSQYVVYDIQNGTIFGSTGDVTASIDSVGNGWYRVKYTRVILSSGTANFRIALADDSGSISYTGSNKQVLLWGAQLVEGTNALPYQRTETRLNIPRIDSSLGGCPSILLEPQRTNLALQSSSFDSATWTKAAVSVTANAAISPSGVQDADLVTANGATTQHNVLQTISAGAKTYSVFAKMGTQRYIQILTSGSANSTANYDLQDGVSNVVGSNSTASIENYGNGWYRCILQTNEVAAANFYVNYVNSLVAPRFQSILSSDTLYLWGAQAEVGAYATSYIQTTTASVTRNNEVYNRTGVSSLIGQTEGTMFVGIYDYNFTPNNTSPYFEIYADANNRIIIAKNTSNQYQVVVRTAGSTVLNVLTASISGNSKIAIGYKENDCVVYVNGVQVGTDTSVTIPTCSAIYLGGSITGISVQKDVFNVAALWKERLTNDQLAQLTTI